MIKKIIFSLGIDVLPKWFIFNLSFISGILGAFNAFLFVYAISGFVTDHLIVYFPEAIAFSGIIGILLYNLNNFLLKNLISKWYITVYFAIILLIFLVPFIINAISLSFWLFIIWFPVTVVNEHSFLSIASKIPAIKNNQNLKRFLETGVMAGTAIFSFIITFFTFFHFKVPIIFPGILCPLLIIIYINYINKEFDNNKVKSSEFKAVDSLTSFLSDLPLKMTILALILFIVLSVLTFVFIDYTFVYSLDSIYTDDNSLTQFLSFFLGFLTIVTLSFKLFVYQNLIKTFRISKAILASPIIILFMLFTINILFLTYKHTELKNPFTIVFMVIVLSRFVAYLLRESFEFYSLKLVLTAIETYSKKIISKNITSLLILWSLILGGLILLIIKSFDVHAYRTIILINTAFTIVWIYIANWLSQKYKRAIERNIEKLSSEYKPNDQLKIKNFKDRVMLTTNLSGLRYLLNYQRNYQPYNFQQTIELIPFAVQNQLGLNGSENTIIKEKSDYTYYTEQNLSTPEQIYFYDSDESTKVKIIEVLATSVKVKDRIRAVQMIESTKDRKYTNILKMLIRDLDNEVKRNAIFAVSVFYDPSLIRELLDLLNDEEFADIVADVFAKIGSDAVDPLISVFNRMDIDFKTQTRIIKIIGKISSENALRFLLEKLDYPNKWLTLEIVKSLIDVKYKSDILDHNSINKAIINTIGTAAWLLAMDVSIEKMARLEPVRKAIEEEYEVTMDLLFYLLQLKYNDGIILQAKKYLITNADNEQSELSVELLDYILDDELKYYLFPLIHNNQKFEKISQLQQIYPISLKGEEDALKEIINIDLGRVCLWTKACALIAYIERNNENNLEDIFTQAFNPEPLMNEIAFSGLIKYHKDKIGELFERLPTNQKRHLNAIFNKGNNYDHKLLFNKVIFLQKISVFEKVKGHHLIPFAEILKEHYLTRDNSIFINCSEEDVLPVFTVSQGDVSIVDLQKRTFRLNRNYLYGLGLYAGGITLKTYSEAIVYMADPENIGTLVINHEELSDALFKYIQNSNFY